MISYEDALRLIQSALEPLGVERVSLAELSGRVLAEPLVSPIDLPGFDNSAVDGYGIRAEDAALRLRVVREVAAGDDPAAPPIGLGEAVRIFTGSAIPAGVDAVVMQEDVRRDGDSIEITGRVTAGDHIRPRGDELRQGGLAHPAGSRVTPPVLGLVAALGLTEATVYRRPCVAILGTGSELVVPGEPLGPGQVYEANTYALRAAIEGLGLPITSCRAVRDDAESTREALREALQADVVLTCGGVSVGDHDLVRESFAALGVEERLWRISMKPGKPFYFGVGPQGQTVFGLPGNPVSALVTFNVLVRPALRKLVGLPPVAEQAFPLGLGHGFPRTQNRAEFVRAALRDGKAYPLSAQGSHMLSGLAQADVLLHLPPNSGPYQPGDDVLAIPIRWD